MARRYVLGPNAARKLTELLRGKGEVSRRAGVASELAFDSEYVAPFTVQWAQSADDGAGAWIVWLPASDLVVTPEGALNPASALSAVGGEYPTGWYALDSEALSPSAGGTLYLVLDFGDSPSATFAAEADDGDDTFSIPVCVASVDAETGERRVKQLVVGAIALRGTGAAEAAPTPFMVGTYQRDARPGEEGDDQGKVTVAGIVNGAFYWDGELTTVDSIDVPVGQATVYLNCTGTKSASGYSWTFSLGTSPASSEESDTVCKSFKLYDFDGGAVAMDYRDTFLAIASGTAEKIEPDGASLDFVPAAAEGEEPNGDEGKLEVKGYKAAAVGKVPYKSTGGIVWGGKTILRVDVSASETEQVVTFTYSDGSTTEIHIPHGIAGEPGEPGQDGETPEITAEKNGGVTHIYADGALIAEIKDGHTPEITADENGGVITIYADGVAIAQINVGEGSGDLSDKNVVTDVSFSISDGKLVATLSKENLKTGVTSQDTKTVCDVAELDVVTEETYSTNTHQFTNTRKRIKVIGTPSSASGQTPFTATPLSGE